MLLGRQGHDFFFWRFSWQGLGYREGEWFGKNSLGSLCDPPPLLSHYKILHLVSCEQEVPALAYSRYSWVLIEGLPMWPLYRHSALLRAWHLCRHTLDLSKEMMWIVVGGRALSLGRDAQFCSSFWAHDFPYPNANKETHFRSLQKCCCTQGITLTWVTWLT